MRSAWKNEKLDFSAHIGYTETMSNDMKNNKKLRVAMRLQALEGNPLSVDQVSMFEMFEREDWPQEQRMAYIQERAAEAARVPAAE